MRGCMRPWPDTTALRPGSKTGRFMGQHGADELARRAGKQARVRVEGEYIPRPREGLRIPGQDFQAAGALAQEPGQVQQRAALALEARPEPVPAPGFLQRQKRVEAAAVFCSAPPRRARRRASPGVRGQLGGFGLRQVRQQAEGQVPQSRGARENSSSLRASSGPESSREQGRRRRRCSAPHPGRRPPAPAWVLAEAAARATAQNRRRP